MEGSKWRIRDCLRFLLIAMIKVRWVGSTNLKREFILPTNTHSAFTLITMCMNLQMHSIVTSCAPPAIANVNKLIQILKHSGIMGTSYNAIKFASIIFIDGPLMNC